MISDAISVTKAVLFFSERTENSGESLDGAGRLEGPQFAPWISDDIGQITQIPSVHPRLELSASHLPFSFFFGWVFTG